MAIISNGYRMRLLLTISLALACQPLHADGMALSLLRLPLAGSQYHALAHLWTELSPGSALSLIREADNRFDPDAIRVEWRGQKIGYLPRSHNRPFARALDAGMPLHARIHRLQAADDPWQRVELEVLAGL